MTDPEPRISLEQHPIQELSRWRQRYEKALKASDRAIYEYDFKTNQMVWAGDTLGLLGYHHGEMPQDLTAYLQFIHPEDQACFQQVWHRLADHLNLPYWVEYRLLRRDGSFLCVEDRFRAYPDEQGTLNQVMGCITRLKDRKTLDLCHLDRHPLTPSQGDTPTPTLNPEQLLQIINGTADGLIVLDRLSGTIRFANTPAQEMFGCRSLAECQELELGLLITTDRPFELEIFSPIPQGLIFLEVYAKEITWEGQAAYLLSLRDISNRKQAEISLFQSEERYRALAESSHDLIFTVTPDLQRIPYLNTRTKEYFYPNQESNSTLSPLEIALQRIEELGLQLSRVLITQSSVHYEGRLVNEGTSQWLDIWLSPIINEFEEIDVIQVVARDLTERKRTEETLQTLVQEKELLLREVHHRVNNNLQMVASLLKRQTKGLNNEGAMKSLKESQSRIEAMALMYQCLYQTDQVKQVPLHQYIHQIADHIFQDLSGSSRGIQLNLTLNEVFLNIETAIPCGLLVNELLRNCLEHAFPTPDNASGIVKISLNQLKITDEAEKNRNNSSILNYSFILSVADNGVGLPNNLVIQEAQSVGLRLVNDLVRQLGGKMCIQRHVGTQYSIYFSEVRYRDRIRSEPSQIR